MLGSTVSGSDGESSVLQDISDCLHKRAALLCIPTSREWDPTAPHPWPHLSTMLVSASGVSLAVMHDVDGASFLFLGEGPAQILAQFLIGLFIFLLSFKQFLYIFK